MLSKTQYYLTEIRKKTAFSDYRIAKEYNINQSNLSKYSSGKAALSEMHAWLFADILNISPAEVVASTKLEQAQINKNKEKIEFWQEQLEKILNNTKSLKIQIAQTNPTVGDIDNNATKIIDLTINAHKSGVHLIIFPELALIGYPPEDLLLRDKFITDVEKNVELIKTKIPDEITVIFGAITKIDTNLYNSAYLIHNSKIRIYHKQELPNYGVFDEKRYFKVKTNTMVFECQQQKIALLICEDIWVKEHVDTAVNQGAKTIISINASPFEVNKKKQRINIIKQRVLENNIDFIYVNMVGAQDELVFDGGSFMMNNKAQITHQLPLFIEDTYTIDLNAKSQNKLSITTEPIEKTIYNALVLAVKDYVNKNNFFNGAIIGLSGGIDSALTLAIAVDALGADKVQAIMMPYKYTADISIEDAKRQAQDMKVDYHQIDIYTIVDSFNSQLNDIFNNSKVDNTEENLQARTRATLLMAISNKFGKIVLTTGNKSEMAVGYATLYGDMSGGFAPLKDVLKTMVYKLAIYRNSISQVIPKRVIEREPSAELAPNQIDKDSLPPYDELDAILELFIEQKQSINKITAKGFNADVVKRIANMVLKSEYKRRQSAPGPKISNNAFGKERRYPITAKFKP